MLYVILFSSHYVYLNTTVSVSWLS